MNQVATLSGEGVSLAYDDSGAGSPVIFQHGLGGDRRQTAEAFGEQDGLRRVALECRGHASSDYGPYEELSITTFGNDVARLAGRLGLASPVIGGISMGAAIALRLAVHGKLAPRGLILARPAWLFDPAPQNMQVYSEVGRLLLENSPENARAKFLAGASADLLRAEAPDNLASLTGFFDRAEPQSFGQLLVRIANDGPGVSEAEARRIKCPVLVIGHSHDLVHPLSYARQLANTLPNAQLVEITPKAVDKRRYLEEFQSALRDFTGRLE